MIHDKITLDRIQRLHPKLRAEGLAIYNEIVAALTGNATVRFAFTFRTFAEQADIYAQGRTKPGKIVTKSPPGYSFHNYGLAIDIVLLIDRNGDGKYEEASWDTLGDYDGDKISDWMECVKILKKYRWKWGADWDNDGITKAQGDKDEHFVDKPHFEKTFGYTTKQLLDKHLAKQVDVEGYVLL